jgi:hypothetical protein
MADDQNRVTIAGDMVAHINTLHPIRDTIAGEMVVHVETIHPIRDTIAGIMVVHKSALAPLVTSGGAGPAVQIMDG